ncbi:hypothetical protein [Nocardiopsis oceani]
MADTHAVERAPFRAAPGLCRSPTAATAPATGPSKVTWSTSTLREAPETGLRALHGHG